jgi:HlyD family secretion protein
LPVGQELLPVVPVKSLVSGGESDRLFVVVSGRLEERVVQLGPKAEDRVAIADGIKPGEQVVVAPPPGATDGMQVQ